MDFTKVNIAHIVNDLIMFDIGLHIDVVFTASLRKHPDPAEAHNGAP